MQPHLESAQRKTCQYKILYLKKATFKIQFEIKNIFREKKREICYQ